MSNFCVRVATDNEAIGDVAITPTSIRIVSSTGFAIIHDPYCGTNSYLLTPVTEVPLTVDQGIELGWAVGLVWLATYAITFLARYINSEIQGGRYDTDT